MAFSKKDALTYRRDEKLGHKLLSPEERIKLAKPYLPTPRPTSQTKPESGSHFGIRRFLKLQLFIFVSSIIHALFSLWLRLRSAYHAVVYRTHSVLYYHHHTPELIARDVKNLSRLPKHLSVILSLDKHSKGGDELQQLVSQAADVAAWSASAGIPRLSIYENTGVLKNYVAETHRAMSRKLTAYFGRDAPALALSAPHVPSIESPSSPRSPSRGIAVMLLSADDGRESIVDLTKTLADMAQRSKISTSDISIDLIDAELSESVVGAPDLMILFGPHVELDGYPPWQIHLTEIFHLQDNNGVEYQVFYRGLCSFAHAQMRFGR